jgi:cephalosporin hydroxylase
MTSTLWRHTGTIWPLGVSCSLTWYDLGAIAHILQGARIRAVLEIGVEHGGLAAYLAAYCHATKACTYRGIDITLNALDWHVRTDMGEAILERDAWSDATVAEVRAWLAAVPAPALIICDGGDKPKELKLYAPLLRTGDVLIGHDYHNEYGDTELADMPAMVEQVHEEWLDDTLLCMFVRRGER